MMSVTDEMECMVLVNRECTKVPDKIRIKATIGSLWGRV